MFKPTDTSSGIDSDLIIVDFSNKSPLLFMNQAQHREAIHCSYEMFSDKVSTKGRIVVEAAASAKS